MVMATLAVTQLEQLFGTLNVAVNNDYTTQDDSKTDAPSQRNLAPLNGSESASNRSSIQCESVIDTVAKQREAQASQRERRRARRRESERARRRDDERGVHKRIRRADDRQGEDGRTRY